MTGYHLKCFIALVIFRHAIKHEHHLKNENFEKEELLTQWYEHLAPTTVSRV